MNLSLNIEAVNQATVIVGDLTLWFSYRTVIGFHHPSTGTVVSENLWGPTTGKHINSVAGKDFTRTERNEFTRQLNQFEVTVK